MSISTPVWVTTWYLEQRSPDAFRPAWSDRPDLTVLQAQIPSPELSRFLYTSVGGDWHWHTRLSWSYSQWQTYLSQPTVETWVAYLRGTPAGYIELHAPPEPDHSVEIAYFGLLKPFIGQGIGKHLLSVGIQRAWQLGDRVWVHTCSLDSPHALKNYEARGLQRYRETQTLEHLPPAPIGPWPGAYGES
jgi:GNAT superfamily N-acetyltransferase